MSPIKFLIRTFKDYYKKNEANLREVSDFTKREFAFLPWDKSIMLRHMGFENIDTLNQYIINSAPRHVYSSGTLYKHPEIPNMEKKGYEGCDLIVDIDVDHFYTPCKDDHDGWYCKSCLKNGKGMPPACPECGSLKIKRISWICEKCLDIAKKEVQKLLFNFLIPDFGIDQNSVMIAFSGHRGYHLKVEDESLRPLSSEARREIVDYLTGENLNFELLGLRTRSGIVYGISQKNLGWARKLNNEIQLLLTQSDMAIEHFLLNLGFKKNHIKSFLNYKDTFLETFRNSELNDWSVEGFDINKWKIFLKGIAKRVGANIDEPVSIDIHRLIRYPGTLHGRTGFKVQDLSIEELEEFNPLDANNKSKDPIVFEQEGIEINLKIVEEFVPATKIKGITYGPYDQGDKIKVPKHIADYLLCKEVAEPVSMI
jgi:DNA primase small subunit